MLRWPCSARGLPYTNTHGQLACLVNLSRAAHLQQTQRRNGSEHESPVGALAREHHVYVGSHRKVAKMFWFQKVPS